MIFDLGLMIVAFLLVVKGGGWFVDASIVIARHFRWPRILVGGTLVTLATTAPELIVSLTASASGHGGLSIGNAVGSVIVNSGFVIGVVALMSPMVIRIEEFRPRAVWMFTAAVGLVMLSWSLRLERWAGFLLCALAVGYLINDYFQMKRQASMLEEGVDEAVAQPIAKQWFWFVVGAVLILIGSRLLVTSAVSLAERLGISSIIIGLTLIAFGTSLPEFITAVISARRDASDLSVGNILAANIVNLTLVAGGAASIQALEINEFTRRYSYSVMLLLILVLIAAFWRGRAGKKAGLILLVIYLAYTAGLIIFQKQCDGFFQQVLLCSDVL